MAVSQIRQFDFLSSDDRHKLLISWNDTREDWPEQSLLDVVHDPSVYGDRIAIVAAEKHITYGGLYARARGVSHMVQERGIGRGEAIGVALQKSPEAVIAILGILGAGCAYVPLDVSEPIERLASLVQGTNQQLLFADSGLDGLCIDGLRTIGADAIRSVTAPTWARRITAVDIAYIIHTSGSTGGPKPVVISHGNLMNSTLARIRNYAQPPQLYALVSPLHFDSSVAGLFWTLLAKGTLLLVESGVARNVDALAECIGRHEPTHVLCLPTLYRLLLERGGPQKLKSLMTVIVAGESCDGSIAERHSAGMPKTQLYNEYGPTEATVWATVHEQKNLPLVKKVPIGRPVANTKVYVLNDGLELAPVGVVGELYIGGRNVGRGYWNRPGPTATHFIASPYGTYGERLYRTGDLARWQPDGALEFMGRSDLQVKVRGYRVELGEIETALRSHEWVREGIASFHQDDDGGHLVGYVTLESRGQGTAEMWSRLEEWRSLYDSAYSRQDHEVTTDWSGWTSSYTGDPLPHAEMEIWLVETLRHIRKCGARTILEIGAGIGRLPLSLAGEFDRYIGVEPSTQALRVFKEWVVRASLTEKVDLINAFAHQLETIPDKSVDLVILNSVIQYFPDVSYLLVVLSEAYRVTKDGGHIFVGDVRSHALLEAFHLSVQLDRMRTDCDINNLKKSVRRALRNERELVVDEKLFQKVALGWPRGARVRILPKHGSYRNELILFRYDVLLDVGTHDVAAAPDRVLQWDSAGRWRDDVITCLSQCPTSSLELRGIRNARVSGVCTALRRLKISGASTLTVRDLNATARSWSGEDPDEVESLFRHLGVDSLLWSSDAPDNYNVLLNPQWIIGKPHDVLKSEDCKQFVNVPVDQVDQSALVVQLREHLKRTLPEHMIPSSLVVVAELPTTSTGKVDRKALQPPMRRLGAPQSTDGQPLEEMLCRLVGEVLSVHEVRPSDNFFALGGHSLLAVTLITRARAMLGVEIPLDAVFAAETIGALAKCRKDSPSESQPRLGGRPRPARVPLAYPQQRLWFLNCLNGGTPEYNMRESLRIVGDLDVPSLQRSLHAVVERHEALRTRFATVGGEPYQIIESDVALPLQLIDISAVDEAQRFQRLTEIADGQAASAFDLTQSPLVRIAIVKCGQREHVLLRTVHHIISDGWSEAIFNRELWLLYEAFTNGRGNPLAPLTVQYPDYALWQRELLSVATMKNGMDYWTNHLQGAPALELASGRARPTEQDSLAGQVTTFFDGANVDQMKELAVVERATLFMVMLSGLGILLSRYADQDDLVVGSPIANRENSELENLIGCFVNFLPFRIRVKPYMTVRELIRDVRRIALDAFERQYIPFDKIVEAITPSRSLDATPVFRVAFAFQNAPQPVRTVTGLDIAVSACQKEVRVRFDIEIHATSHDNVMYVHWLYKQGLFDNGRIAQMAEEYKRVLSAMVSDPNMILSRLSITGL